MGKDTTRSTRRARTNFTTKQLQAMESVFQEKQYPDVTTLTILSERTGLQTEKVCTWFQNRRSKFRKQSKNGHVTWMRTQIYSGEHTERNVSSSPTDVATNALSALTPTTTTMQQPTYGYPSYPNYHGHPYFSAYHMRQVSTSSMYTGTPYPYSCDYAAQTYPQPNGFHMGNANITSLTSTAVPDDFLLDFLPSDWSAVMGQSSPLSSCMYSYNTSSTGAY